MAAALRALRRGTGHADASHGADPARHDRFWALLLAAPPLRRQGRPGQWPADLAALGALAPGTRAALLLRLVGGLDDARIAGVLHVAPETVRRAIAHARLQPAGAAPAAPWEPTARAIERRVEHFSAERLARLAVACDGAPRAGNASPREVRPPRRRRPVLAMAIVAAACALLFAASFLLAPAQDDPRVAVVPLPAADAPAARYDDVTALLTHPDLEQLADTRDAALVRDLDFYAWYAAQLDATGGATPVLMPDAGHGLPAAPAGVPHASP